MFRLAKKKTSKWHKIGWFLFQSSLWKRVLKKSFLHPPKKEGLCETLVHKVTTWTQLDVHLHTNLDLARARARRLAVPKSRLTRGLRWSRDRDCRVSGSVSPSSPSLWSLTSCCCSSSLSLSGARALQVGPLSLWARAAQRARDPTCALLGGNQRQATGRARLSLSRSLPSKRACVCKSAAHSQSSSNKTAWPTHIRCVCVSVCQGGRIVQLSHLGRRLFIFNAEMLTKNTYFLTQKLPPKIISLQRRDLRSKHSQVSNRPC